MRPLLPLVFAVACGTTATDPVTYHADIRPLVEARCASCHTSGDAVAPFALSSFAELEAVGGIAVAAVEARVMPPWLNDDDSCRESIGSQWLSDEEVALFSDWRDGGYVEGDPADYVAPDLFEPPVPSREPDTVVAMADYAPNLEIPDDYRCLVIGEPLVDDLFVTGTRVRPGNLNIAHHALLFAVPPSELATIAALEGEDAEQGYTCFGDPGSERTTLVAGWAPGGEGYNPLGEGMARRVPAGSQFVLQMHYNTLGGSAGDTDATAVDLWSLAPGVVPDELVIQWPVVDQTLNVPAGASASIQRQSQRIPVAGRIIASSPHMHLLGTALETRLIRDNGDEECIADVPRWDFAWQGGYAFQEPVEVGWSDRLEIACTYDNSAENQPVVDGVQVEPGNVTWGEGTLDEMCLNYVSVATPFYGEGTGEVCDGYTTCAEDCAADDVYCHINCMASAGEPCFRCGIDGMFGDCTVTECLTEGYFLQECTNSCASSAERQLDCLYDQCGSEFEAYWACAEPLASSGDCAEDYADCPLIAGSAAQ
ncbi:MAG: hypothetical protein KC912_25755 [Proteobacteria bacterium]|nr:hypothetical protein [Pseudomonadota bacterium]